MNQVKAKYTISQIKLYIFCRLSWNNVLRLHSHFSNFSNHYTLTFINDRLTAIDAAQAMPDYNQRKSRISNKRLTLQLKLLRLILKHYKQLKRFITYEVPPQYLDIALDEAGKSYLELAENENWAAANQLLQAMHTYVTLHLNTLLAAGLSPQFPTDLTNTYNTFDTAHIDFLKDRQGTKNDTSAKIIANNQIYDDLMALFIDAKIIFSDNPTLRSLFTLADLKKLTTSANNAGIKGNIKSKSTKKPLPGVHLYIPETGDFTTTDTNGNYTLTGIPANKYELVATYTPPNTQTPIVQKIPITIHKGTISTIHLNFP